jgi:hypothetical protein
MGSELVVSAMAMIVSVVALGTSTLISAAQTRSMRKANDLPVMIELLTKDYVKAEFQDRERLVIEALASDDGELGFEQLPEPLRSAAYHVAWYYNAVGVLVALGSIDERIVIGGINYKLRRVWSAMEPHIRAERKARGKPFLDGFEHLAARAFATDPLMMQREVGFQTVPETAERIAIPSKHNVGLAGGDETNRTHDV